MNRFLLILSSLLFCQSMMINQVAGAEEPLKRDLFLYMAEEEGCYWCGRWNKEIGGIYPNTQEGKSAPLRRYDLHSEQPEGVELKMGVNFTPTFLLVSKGKEVGRIEGYPGEDFFWGLLGMLFEQADLDLSSAKVVAK